MGAVSYTHLAKGFKVEVLDYQAGDEAGIKSVTLSFEGPNAYGLLKSEMGAVSYTHLPPLIQVEVSLIKILKTSGNPCQGKFHWFY